jgi:uncharacterized membrane-anchored protein YitT (DUF2179 family)
LATIFGGIILGVGVGLIIGNGGSLDGIERVAIVWDEGIVHGFDEDALITILILTLA